MHKAVPPEETATREELTERILHYGNHFWLLFDGDKMAAFAGELIRCAIDNAGEAGRKGLVLTCKDELVHYYAGFGFKDEGITDKSTHGNVAWHQMRLEF